VLVEDEEADGAAALLLGVALVELELDVALGAVAAL